MNTNNIISMATPLLEAVTRFLLNKSTDIMHAVCSG